MVREFESTGAGGHGLDDGAGEEGKMEKLEELVCGDEPERGVNPAPQGRSGGHNN